MSRISPELNRLHHYQTNSETAREPQVREALETIQKLGSILPTLNSGDLTSAQKEIEGLKSRLSVKNALSPTEQKVLKSCDEMLHKIEDLTEKRVQGVFEHAAHVGKAFQARARLTRHIQAKPLSALEKESLNKVYLATAPAAVFKTQEGPGEGVKVTQKEVRAATAAAHLGAPETLHPSIRGDLSTTAFTESEITAGQLEAFQKMENWAYRTDEGDWNEVGDFTELQHLYREGTIDPWTVIRASGLSETEASSVDHMLAALSVTLVTGNVQPLIENCVECSVIAEDRALFYGMAERLNLPDAQKKTLVQGLIGNRDLHMQNGMMQPVANETYQAMQEYQSWEYLDAEGDWQAVDSFFALHQLYVKGAISDLTQVRATGFEAAQIGGDTRLVEALNVSWQFVFFDNEDAFPFYNDYRTTSDGNLAPVQIFMLGMGFTDEPLDPEVTQWVQTLPKTASGRRTFLEEGNPNLWRRLSPETKEALKEHFTTEEYTRFAHAKGSDKEALFATLPQPLLQRIHADLHLSWTDTTRFRETCSQLETALQQMEATIRERGTPDELEEFQEYQRGVLAFLQNPETTYLRSAETLDYQLQDLRSCIESLSENIEGLDPSQVSSFLVPAQNGECPLTAAYKESGLQTFHQKNSRLLQDNLFPPMPPLAAQALQERIERLTAYVEQCTSRGTEPTVKGAFDALYPKLAVYRDLIEQTKRKHSPQPPDADELADMKLEASSSLGHFESPCEKVLQDALEAGVFARGEEDPAYQELLRELEGVHEAIGSGERFVE